MPGSTTAGAPPHASAHYSERVFHGLCVRVAAASPALEAAVLQEFPGEDWTDREEPERGSLVIEAGMRGSGDELMLPPAPLQPGAVGLSYLVTPGRVWLETQAGSRGLFDLAAGTARLQIAAVPPRRIEGETAALLGVGLPYLYREGGLYAVHCAAVLAEDTPVLLAGPSGSGKSTTAALLARTGFRFLADDLVLLEATAQALTLRGIPRDPRLDAAARRRVGDFRTSRESEPGGLVKGTATARPPALILFPTVQGGAACMLEALSPLEALEGLIRCSLLLGEKAQTGRHLSALAALAGQSTAYRLHLGTATDPLPGMIRALPALSRSGKRDWVTG